jgi:hypothetical protein
MRWGRVDAMKISKLPSRLKCGLRQTTELGETINELAINRPFLPGRLLSTAGLRIGKNWKLKLALL